MSDETVQLGGFGSLVKKIQENNKQVSEEDLSSLFSQTLENSESGAISAADFSNTLSETYGLENNAELLETIYQIAQNDGDEDGLTIEDFKIQKEYDDYSKQIFDATAGKLTTDEDSFNEVLNNENLTGEDWANIIQSYENLYGRNLINDIVEDFSGITESALRNQIMEKIASKLTESIENGSELALEVACEQLSRSISVSHVNKKATDFIINLLGSSDRTNALILNKYAEITGSDLIADIDFNPNIQKADKDLIKYRLETAKLFDLDGSSNQLSAYEELDLNNYSLEDQNKAWVINLLAQNLNGSLLDFQNQNNEDGSVSGGFNLIKSLTGIGVSSGDITSCLTQQRELIKELTLALNGKSEKYLSFEEAYKDLTGVEYNEDKIIEYKENENNYIIACEAMQRAQTFQNSIAEAETLQNAYDLFVEYFGDEQIGKEEFLSYIRSGMMPDPDNDDDINDKLVTFGYVKDVYFDENGQLVVTKITNYGKKRSPDEEDKIEVLVHDLSSTSNMIRTLPRTFDNTKYTSTVENTIKECFGGSIEDLQKRYSDSKKEALGTADKLEETVNKYCQSQDGFIDKLCGITQMVGIGTMAVGGVVSFVNIPLGSGIMTAGKYMALSGMFGDNVLGTVDGLTSADGLSKEEVAELVKETAMEVGYIVLGSGINNIAEAAQRGSLEALRALGMSQKSATVLSWLAEGGTDMALSVLSDLIITGDLNLGTNSLQTLMGILTGVAGAKTKSYKAKISNAENIINGFKAELQGKYSGNELNAEILKRAGYSSAEADNLVSRYGTDSNKIHNLAVKKCVTTGCSALLSDYGIDVNKLTPEEVVSKGRALDSLLKNVSSLTQDSSSSCAIVAILNGVLNKGELLPKLLDRFEFDETTGNWKCTELGIDGVKIGEGDNLLVKIYEQYKLNNPDSHGDFATRILNDLLPGGEDVITKLTAQNVAELMSYAQDSSTLLTFNVGNKVSGVDIQPNHAYTVLGFDANGNIKIQDPQTNKIITVDKTKYEALDAQIEGKTFALDGIVDGSKGRFVAGSEWEAAGDTIRRIRAKNEKFISQLDEAHKITIGGREFFATEAQKAEYNKMLASFDGKVEPEVAQQLVMSDVMLPEALAKLGGIDISDCKTQEQVFKKLVEAYIENDGIFDKLGLDQNYIDAYLSRDSLTHSLSAKNGMSGDKIVHEICKALAGKLKDDDSFAQEWSNYCSTSEVYKQYSTMVKVYETELKNTLGSNYQYLRNAEHLIFRMLQRDSIVDTSSLANKELSMDLSGYDVDDLPTFIDNLAKLISEVNAGSRVIEFNSEGEAPPVEFMNGILMITKDPKTGKIMIETYEYKFSQGQKWDTHADYIPQAPSW